MFVVNNEGTPEYTDGVVARLGGDEFAVLISDLPSLNSAGHMAIKLMDTIRRRVR